jgi:curved DNA-binding protein
MPQLRDSNQHGDLYAKANVVLPKDLSTKEKALFRELAQVRSKGH